MNVYFNIMEICSVTKISIMLNRNASLEFDKKYEKVKNDCVNNFESYSQRFFQATCISFLGPFSIFISVFFFLLTILSESKNHHYITRSCSDHLLVNNFR